MASGNQEALNAVFARFPMLETERFFLRAPSPEDTPDLYDFMSDPQVSRYLGRAPMVSIEEAAKRIDTFRTYFETGQSILWGVVPRGENRLIGTCVLWNLIPAHYRAEIGYILAPAWWGKGAMTEVVSAVVNFGFTHMALHSIEAQIDPENTGSRRLLEKLGFVQEGYFREDYYHPIQERFTDTAVFSLLESTWKSRTPSG